MLIQHDLVRRSRINDANNCLTVLLKEKHTRLRLVKLLSNRCRFLQLIGGNYQQTTRKIFEPIYYFVIPTATTVTGVKAAPGAKTSTFKADNGRTVVKIDYSGTGITVNTDDGAKDGQVNLANNPDA